MVRNCVYLNKMRHIKYLLLFVVSQLLNTSYAQKNDYIWLTGYDSQSPDTFHGYRFGNTKLDFNYNPVAIRFDSIKMNFDLTNTSYSDSDGNLLFYTNGIYVANARDEEIANSDSLNAGWYQYDWAPDLQVSGYNVAQGIMALPDIAHPNCFYLVHSLIDSIPGSGGTSGYYSKIQSTYLDMTGTGRVIYKNQPLLTGSFGGDLTAVRHGNGRDWWMLIQKRNSNCFYYLLLDSTGFHVEDSTCLGGNTIQGEISTSCFSPDGSRFAYLTSSHGLTVYNFERCTGRLSNAHYLSLPIIADSNLFRMGVAISPSSRFLYVSIALHIYQFDLWREDMFNNIDTIANWEGYYFLSPIFRETFDNPQLAPDGKIYITCGSSPYFNVINHPDFLGNSCGFVPHGDSLAGISLGVPNFPNYRLGALTQSQCDSLSTYTQSVRDTKEELIKLYPNPTNDYFIVDYGFTDWNKAQPYLEICNALGQVVFSQILPMYSGVQKIDVSNFSAGMYTVFIKRNGGVVAAQKMIKSSP